MKKPPKHFRRITIQAGVKSVRLTKRKDGTIPRLVAEDLEKRFSTGSVARLEVVRGLSLIVEVGEVVVIIGDSGTGKSTLPHLLGALDRPDKGKVCYDCQDTLVQINDALSRSRNTSVDLVFQFHRLLPEFSALENVAMPALIAGQGRSKAQVRAETLLEQLGLGMRLGHRPAELSGGEQQRVASSMQSF